MKNHLKPDIAHRWFTFNTILFSLGLFKILKVFWHTGIDHNSPRKLDDIQTVFRVTAKTTTAQLKTV